MRKQGFVSGSLNEVWAIPDDKNLYNFFASTIFTDGMKHLQNQLLPCDMEKPYAFVSYCSADSKPVWEDVVFLQKHKLNLWIDEPNLNKGNNSWREDALRSINNFNCEVVIFYISKNSLLSSACLQELSETLSDNTRKTHNGREVRVIVIEVERIYDLTAYLDGIFEGLNNKPLTSAEKGKLSSILQGFREFFGSNNEKVRVQVGSSDDYYKQIIREIERCTRSLYISTEQIYRLAVSYIIQERYYWATRLLLVGIDSKYLPSILMLAHLKYKSRATAECKCTAQELWESAQLLLELESWKERGERFKTEKYYSEALSYYLAYGEHSSVGLNMRISSLLTASQLWLRKYSITEAKCTARLAADLGSSEAREILQMLSNKTINDIKKDVENDEALF